VASAAGTFAYTPDEGTTLDPGSQRLSAAFTPDDPKFKSVNVSVTLEVDKIDPVIEWADPASVVAGTVLGDTQLDTVAKDKVGFPLAGAYDYSPAAGWLLGYPDQAMRRMQDCCSVAEQLGYPFNLAFAYNWAARVHQDRRDLALTRDLAERAYSLCTEQGFPNWRACAMIMRGWVLSEEGNPPTGTEQMLAGDTLYRSIGGECFRSYFLALLAEAYGKGGRPDEGLRLVGEAIENTSRTEERLYEAELYRVKGELLLRQTESATQQAEGCFLKAIEVARRQGARSLELRVT
jgi:tetratricopeptide (TPR) repeat protein